MNKNLIERLVVIHRAIKANTYPNIVKLQQLCRDATGDNVSKPTLYRDIEALTIRFNAPVKYDRRKKGYHYSEDWDFPLNRISAQDVFYLSAARTLLSGFQGSPLYDEIAKVIDFVTDTQNDGKGTLLKRIAIPPTPTFVVDKQVWRDVIEALQDNCVIEFDYTGRWNTEMTHRRVRPYQLLLNDGVCYLYGFAEERNDMRSFVLNRIKNLKITKDYFELPDDYDFTSHCGGGHFGLFASGELYNYVIDFYKDARLFVKDRVWADDQKITDNDKEGWTRLEFTSTQFGSIQNWVLAQGGNAIPREPEWLVEEWQGHIAQMVKNAEESTKEKSPAKATGGERKGHTAAPRK